MTMCFSYWLINKVVSAHGHAEGRCHVSPLSFMTYDPKLSLPRNVHLQLSMPRNVPAVLGCAQDSVFSYRRSEKNPHSLRRAVFFKIAPVLPPLAEGGKSFSSLSYSGGAFWGCSRHYGPQRGQLHSRLLVSASCIAIGPFCPVAR